MIGSAQITITSELAQSLGEIARDYPEAAITIGWDYRDGLPENEWTITVSDGPGVPTPIKFLLNDQDKHSYISNYGEEITR